MFTYSSNDGNTVFNSLSGGSSKSDWGNFNFRRGKSAFSELSRDSLSSQKTSGGDAFFRVGGSKDVDRHNLTQFISGFIVIVLVSEMPDGFTDIISSSKPIPSQVSSSLSGTLRSGEFFSGCLPPWLSVIFDHNTLFHLITVMNNFENNIQGFNSFTEVEFGELFESFDYLIESGFKIRNTFLSWNGFFNSVRSYQNSENNLFNIFGLRIEL